MQNIIDECRQCNLIDDEMIKCSNLKSNNLEEKLKNLQESATILLNEVYFCWAKDKSWTNHCMLVSALRLKMIPYLPDTNRSTMEKKLKELETYKK